jgi:hypothetical protein
MTKKDARDRLDALALPPEQLKSARRTIQRATNNDDINIVIMDGGDLFITRSRLGRVGRQVFEDTIKPDGAKRVVQKAYDDQGNLVHDDPKGGTP